MDINREYMYVFTPLSMDIILEYIYIFTLG